jgi:asparagine synthase (glutamine-hydrolysing)
MCGIAGLFGKCSSRDKMQRMLGGLRRRGPDDFGAWTNDEKQISLGHTRLSIIDLTAAGHQPMFLNDKSYGIVFNGEIYNYKELRKELEARGAVFDTHTDTEVILWGWRIFGKDILLRLRGMFAFAIWNSLSNTLTLVRDRMGIKTLLWCRTQNGLVFSSTLKSLLDSGEVQPVLNEQGLFDLLIYGSVCQPKTMIKDVWALEPGMMKEFNVKHKSLKSANSNIEIEEGACERYWKLERDEKLARELAAMPYLEQVNITRDKLEEACKYNLVADVPVGSFLSGGVDSTVITALMARQSRHPIKSFSIGFDNCTDLQNELSDARKAAEYIGCDHTEVVLQGSEVADTFDDFIDAIDQPSSDGLNTYWVSKIARQQVKVALSGLGGDELFAGYGFFGWFDADFIAQKTSWVDRILYCAYNFHPHGLFRDGYVKIASLHAKMMLVRRMLSDSVVRSSVSSGIKKVFPKGYVQEYLAGLKINDPDLILQVSRYECKNYLLNTLLRDADALSMAHSLEIRPIFLDSGLVEHALALPARSKWRNGVGKAILRDASQDLLPENFLRHPKKGFVLPLGRWLHQELHEQLIDSLSSPMATQVFSQKFINRIRQESFSKTNGSHTAWCALVFLLWAKKFGIQTA